MTLLSISDVAARLGVRPRDISDAFYQQRISAAECPSVAGRRLIPASFVTTIAKALADKIRQRRAAT